MAKGIQRSAIQEWVKWQIITASVFLVDGGIYCLFPGKDYPTFTEIFGAPNVFPDLGPIVQYGPSNQSGEFFLAPPDPIFGPSLPLVGFVALFAAVLCFAIESDFIPAMASIHEMSNGLRIIMYAVFGVICINQLTLIQPALYLLVAAGMLIWDSCSPETPLPK
ncbi:hypothetical protein HDV06_001542 [Boothiomyces sp. JEL0866]|nr:hypothetical protein HDV06_001542 [Boothiomyces sp. JEL0866]